MIRSPQHRAATQLVAEALDAIAAARLTNRKARDELIMRDVELARISRQLRELDEEFTPMRPASRTDVQQAFERSSTFPGKPKP